jgi:hypothetical protein
MAIEIGPGITIGSGIIIGEGASLPVYFIATENSNDLITESGDNLITEN